MTRPVLTTLGVGGHREAALAEGACDAVASLVWGSGSGKTGRPVRLRLGSTAMCSQRTLVTV